MRYVSKITVYDQEVFCAAINQCKGYLEITDSESNTTIEVPFDYKINSGVEMFNFCNRYKDVYGLIQVEKGLLLAWKIDKLDLVMYNYLDFIKPVKRTDIIMSNDEFCLVDWCAPTNALKKSNYTLFFTDNKFAYLDSVKDFHTLGAVIRNEILNIRGLRRYISVDIRDDIIAVSLYKSTYYYRIINKKKFDVLMVKLYSLKRK